MRNTCLIIPVYNEGAVIRGVIENIKDPSYRVVCVNDGSRDNSREEILKTSAYYVEHPINMGQGAALQTGIEFAKGLPGVEYFVTYDADGQHRLEDVKKMLGTIKKQKVDIVLGSRFLGETENMSRTKGFILKSAIQFSNFTSGIKLTDTHNGLRVFNRRVAEKMQITMSDMAHASEILEIIRENNFSYTEIPVKIVYTDYSKAKGQSIFNAVNISFDVLLRRITK